MRRVRQKGTRTERSLGSLLRSLGIGYRLNVKSLPGTPDFANKTRKWAIFVNGCFWHHHRCKLGTTPKRNREFWSEKFADNRKRDAAKIKQLRALGYRVVVIWQCELKRSDEVAARLLDLCKTGCIDTRNAIDH